LDEEVSEERIDEDGISAKRNLKLGDKRGPPAFKSKKRAKIQKKREDRALQYFLKLKYRGAGEGRIRIGECNGTVNFENENLASCEGVVDLPIGDGVPFSAWKISDIPCSSGNKWTDYSERQHLKE
jgi:hypothetical protein